MTPYIILVIYIMIVPIVISYFFNKNIDKKILIMCMLAIWILLSLKSPSVGRDTSGYMKMYQSFSSALWSNYDLYWTEWGYEALEMIFTHIFKLNFVQFTMVIYAFIMYSYYKFWLRYSNDVALSVLIYVCFGFFVFDISGIRNALALSIFLWAIPYAYKKSFLDFLRYCTIVLIAAQIHKSAYVGFLLFCFLRFELNRIIYIIFPIVIFAVRSKLTLLVFEISGKNASSNIKIGGNLIFYVVLLIIPIVFWCLMMKQRKLLKESDDISKRFWEPVLIPMKMIYLGIVIMLFTGESTLIRLANYCFIFVTIILPNSLMNLNVRSRRLVKVFIVIFLLGYFWIFKLQVNELDIIPYNFFWNAN